MRMPPLPLLSVLVLGACGGGAAPVEAPRAVATPTAGVSPTPAPAPSPTAEPLLADETSTLGGGILRARLPRGEVTASDAAASGVGLLVTSVHEVRRASGVLSVSVSDTGERAGADFRERVVGVERAARCATPESQVVAEPEVPAPTGFAVVAFHPDFSCSSSEAPDTRLWVRAPDGSVIELELSCVQGECLSDRVALIEAFVGSFEAGVPTAAPAGARVIGPTPYFALTAQVPEGFVVSRHDGEDYVVYEVFRPHAMGTPIEGLTISFLYSQSPNTLEQDYASRDARVRRVAGTVGGRRTRFLELVREGRTRLVGRISLAEVQLDLELAWTTPESLAELRAIVAGLELPDESE